MRYVSNHWAAMVRHLENGRLKLDNNAAQ